MERTTYKNRPAICIRKNRLSAVFLPEDGGKLVSLSDGEYEYLAQADGAEYKCLLPDGEYVAAECSGFDDMFPTIDPCTVDGYFYPDHGEVCRYPMEVLEAESGFRFCFKSPSMPYVFSKTVLPAEGDSIVIKYCIENTSDKELPFIWAGHIMLKGDKAGEILVPYLENAPIKQMFGEKMKEEADRYILKDYSKEGSSYKFYYTEPISDGWCGYRIKNRTVMFEYDAALVPYLGIWMNNGDFKGMYNVALEPCTAPYDSPENAKKAGICSKIPARGKIEFELIIKLSEEKSY